MAPQTPVFQSCFYETLYLTPYLRLGLGPYIVLSPKTFTCYNSSELDTCNELGKIDTAREYIEVV